MDVYASEASQCSYSRCREEHTRREVPLAYVNPWEECDQN